MSRKINTIPLIGLEYQMVACAIGGSGTMRTRQSFRRFARNTLGMEQGIAKSANTIRNVTNKTMKVIIDDVEYVPKADVPPITDERLREALKHLTAIQYFDMPHKHRAWAWDALDALAPELTKLPPDLAFRLIRDGEKH